MITLNARYCISLHQSIHLKVQPSFHLCFYLRLSLWGFTSRPRFDPQNSMDFLAVGGSARLPVSCLPAPRWIACLLLRQERVMTV